MKRIFGGGSKCDYPLMRRVPEARSSAARSSNRTGTPARFRDRRFPAREVRQRLSLPIRDQWAARREGPRERGVFRQRIFVSHLSHSDAAEPRYSMKAINDWRLTDLQHAEG